MTGIDPRLLTNTSPAIDHTASMENKSVNVLSLDGGGVRGLSTLIILRKLLCMVNQKLNPGSDKDKPIHPAKVFDLIVGTSTGGLIALMMVKFDMNVDECIEKYNILSEQIFKQWHIFGYLSGGFGSVKKFSSRNLEKVLLEQVIEPALRESCLPRMNLEATEYQMEQIDSHPDIMCSVVCNELYASTMERVEGDPIFICSHWDTSGRESPLTCSPNCRESKKKDKVRVIDAARATSAAPTYFRQVSLFGRLLVDGGYGDTNNPSHAAYEHYFGVSRLLRYGYIRMVNIGTGTPPKRPEDYQPERTFIDRVPWLQGAARTTGDLTRIATNSELVGKQMYGLAKMSEEEGSGLLKFERFSANRDEIHRISLHKYADIGNGKIEKITKDYLKDEEVLERMGKMAEQLAETCRTRQRQNKAGGEHKVVISTITKDQGETCIMPQITFSGPCGGETQEEEEYHEAESSPENPPELTDESARGSYELPRTPGGDGQSIQRGRQTEQTKNTDADGDNIRSWLPSPSGLLRRWRQ